MYLIRLLWCQMRPRNDHKMVTVLVTSLSLLASPRAKQSQCSWRVNLPLQVTSFPEHEYCRSWCRGCLAEIYSFSHASPECSPGPESGSTWREEGGAKGGVWTLRKSVLTVFFSNMSGWLKDNVPEVMVPRLKNLRFLLSIDLLKAI